MPVTYVYFKVHQVQENNSNCRADLAIDKPKPNQKKLLTSETNLAVDNAIEKLINKQHTIVKPLRFGKDTKFEEEGKKYSFNRTMKWIDEKFEEEDLKMIQLKKMKTKK